MRPSATPRREHLGGGDDVSGKQRPVRAAGNASVRGRAGEVERSVERDLPQLRGDRIEDAPDGAGDDDGVGRQLARGLDERCHRRVRTEVAKLISVSGNQQESGSLHDVWLSVLLYDCTSSQLF